MTLFIIIAMTVAVLILGLAYFYQYIENADLKVENELFRSQFERLQVENSKLEEEVKLLDIENELLQEITIESRLECLSGTT